MHSPVSPDGNSYVCASCNTTHPILTGAQAIYLGCNFCGAYYKRTGAQLTKIYAANLKAPIKKFSYIQLGSRGELFGTTWTMIGFAAKRERNTVYTWGEYTLFNPKDNSYAFLSEYDGNWVFFREVTELPNTNKKRSFSYQNKTWTLYNDYQSSFDRAIGEFPDDVSDVAGKRTVEYICPPEMLSVESGNKILWLKGTHVEGKTIHAAFQCKAMPSKSSVGAVAPKAYDGRSGQLQKFLWLSLAAMIVLSIVFSLAYHQDYQVYEERFELTNWGSNSSLLVSKPFKVKGNLQNLRIKLTSNVDNSWIEGDFTLINDDTDEEYYFTVGTEFYHGYSGGENWSEGSSADDIILSNIPEGTYHINIVPYRDVSLSTPNWFNIAVYRDSGTPSNFVLIALCIVILIAFVSYQSYSREYNRWSNSNFSPYDHD